MERELHLILAVVSGKGGVGKTTIASNLAYAVASAGTACMLIDADFQNLGCTGLFEAHDDLPDVDMLELLRECDTPAANPLVAIPEVAPSLRFMPATFRMPNSDLFLDDITGLMRRFECVLAALADRFGIRVFILDCHGAVDTTSIAATGIADEAIVITEADSVTFAGTLELLDAYYSAHGHLERSARLSYVVNRIPPKYRWRDLEDIYRKHLASGIKSDAADAGLVFIPTENYVAESFGEYPFQIKLSPGSLFARKIGLLLYGLQERHPAFRLLPKTLASYVRSARKRRRIERRVISTETANLRMVTVAFSLGALATILMLLAAMASVLFKLPVNDLLLGVLVYVLVAPFYVLVMFRTWFYFRERYRFESALVRVLPRDIAKWRKLKLWRLRALYVGAAIGPCTIIAVLGLWILLAVGALAVGAWGALRAG